jgi:hypothetical protein
LCVGYVLLTTKAVVAAPTRDANALLSADSAIEAIDLNANGDVVLRQQKHDDIDIDAGAGVDAGVGVGVGVDATGANDSDRLLPSSIGIAMGVDVTSPLSIAVLRDGK